jgi:hypothetical protein
MDAVNLAPRRLTVPKDMGQPGLIRPGILLARLDRALLAEILVNLRPTAGRDQEHASVIGPVRCRALEDHQVVIAIKKRI